MRYFGADLGRAFFPLLASRPPSVATAALGFPVYRLDAAEVAVERPRLALVMVVAPPSRVSDVVAGRRGDTLYLAGGLCLCRRGGGRGGGFECSASSSSSDSINSAISTNVLGCIFRVFLSIFLPFSPDDDLLFHRLVFFSAKNFGGTRLP